MSELDDAVQQYRSGKQKAARAELAALRATVETQARQLETARAMIERVWEMADNETSKVEIETTSLMWQIEADTRAWLAANAPKGDDDLAIGG
jgi:hypothetical protein